MRSPAPVDVIVSPFPDPTAAGGRPGRAVRRQKAALRDALRCSVTDRYYEDYPVGLSSRLTPIAVDDADVLDFARRFDPQPFHTDPAAAQTGPYGGIIASGWHTCALVMRALVDGYICSASALGSPGIDDLHWLLPVRPGDTLTVEVTVVDARLSRSKPDRGIVRTRTEATNQAGERVFEMTANNLVLTRVGATAG